MPPIEDYGFIADASSAGLVSKSGSIDWLCLPRYDSPAVFAALLDPERGGHWSLAPVSDAHVERSYDGETLILETVFTTDTGRVRLVDCLPLERVSHPATAWSVVSESVIVRRVIGESGSVPMRMDFRPRFDYGAITPWFRMNHGVIEAVGGADALDLSAGVDLRIEDGAVAADFEVREGDEIDFLASYHASSLTGRPVGLSDCAELVSGTRDAWEAWARRCTYAGRWRPQVIRGLLTLKALTFAPSGGVVAAATTSLPEHIGGARNWDYRHCWLRDATFTLNVLLQHGYTEEAAGWRDWLLRAVAGDPHDLQIMYGLMGERRLVEIELDWLAGYEGSRPVRTGNAAHRQFQLDVYGEVLDSFYSARLAGIEPSEDGWELEKRLVDFVCEHWVEPDEGIWEVRSGRYHFVHSKVMAWVAIDRAVKTVEDLGRDAPEVDRWRVTREEIRDEVMALGVVDGRFRRAYDDDRLDASLLMLPLVGFIDADDDVMRSTIEAIERELMVDGFLLRYRTEEVDDGLPPGEGAFFMCTFWLVDCYVLLGRHDEALALFERLLGTCNDVGLLSEQYDPRARRLLGNFPQAFSHVALVTSATVLEDAERGARRARGRYPQPRPVGRP